MTDPELLHDMRTHRKWLRYRSELSAQHFRESVKAKNRKPNQKENKGEVPALANARLALTGEQCACQGRVEVQIV